MNPKIKNMLNHFGIPAIFILLIIGCHAKHKHNKQRLQECDNIDNATAKIWHDIDSLQAWGAMAAKDSLANNELYLYITQNPHLTDSLNDANNKLINQAYNTASRKTMFDIVPCNATVFSKYSHVPGVWKMGREYSANIKTIKEYNEGKASLAGYESAVRHHFDSIMYARVGQYQKELDSLLRRKNEVLKTMQK